ncbi:hypothetical protein F4775DRAFT_580598 [Biscogniauxia sp. FL1348]|nr:hypothetical protein F4775DRAFT_580598 [Biscogniauxia sp. FL1348]
MSSSSSSTTRPPPPSSSSAAPQSPSTQQPTDTNTSINADALEAKRKFVHNVALGGTPLALAALFLPPRRLDLRASFLGGFALWGTNQLAYEYSGRSFAQRLQARLDSISGGELPEKARVTQARLLEEKRRRKRLSELQSELQRRQGGKEKEKEEEEEEERGLLQKIWMGDQPDDWRERRERREKEALSEGGSGYWGLITEQVWEVFTRGGRAKDEEGKKDGGGEGSASGNGGKGSSSSS